jgi:hypothetical protein
VIDLSASKRIEYTCKDFGGIFKPKSLIIGNGLYADIYYGKSIATTTWSIGG